LWEAGVASAFISSDEVLELINYPSYFKLTKQRLPDNRIGILDRLVDDQLISPDVGDRWNILNLGAILFANDLSAFERLERKKIRIIQYAGKNRAAVAREQELPQGYANGFEKLIDLVNSILPRNEHVGKALRQDKPVYPELAIRELIPNALIHQDMTIRGAGPTIEIYKDRIEITNPGAPLVDITRFLGAPPRSRNEAMAALMRRMNVCEERGSGIVKVVHSAEIYQLPAPDFRTPDNNVQVALFAPRTFKDMDAAERLRACHQHAALKFITGERMTNASLRDRLGIADQNAAQVSRIIKQALAGNLIRAADPDSPRAGYVPTWA
jgi:predicted HTH transcriptional regulator